MRIMKVVPYSSSYTEKVPSDQAGGVGKGVGVEQAHKSNCEQDLLCGKETGQARGSY